MEGEAVFNTDWINFIGRFFLNLAVALIIGILFYYRRGRGSRQYLFTYLSSSLVVFLVCILVSQVKVELGLAIGLFAVFSIIRFRSVSASARELAYLLISLGMALVLALLPLNTPWPRILINFLLILSALGLFEFLIFRERIVEKTIIYDRLELLAENRETELLRDLETRFGLKEILRIRIGDIDTLKSRVRIRVRLRDREGKHLQE